LLRGILLLLLLACSVAAPAAGPTVTQDPGDTLPPPLPPLTSPYLKGEGPRWFYLQAGYHEARLMWMPPSWPAGLKGFNVKRREPGGRWKTLNRGTILPTLFDEDMRSRTNDKHMRESLRWLREGRAGSIVEQPRPLDEVLQQLGTLSGYAKRQAAVLITFERALLFGFGYQDSKIPQGDTFEYGLFGVARDGTEIAQPMGVRRWERGSGDSLTLRFGEPVSRFAPDGHLAQVSWFLSREDVEVNLIREVSVQYVDPEGQHSQLLQIPAGVVEAGGWFHVDVPESHAPGEYYLYLSATSYFGVHGRSQSAPWPDPPTRVTPPAKE